MMGMLLDVFQFVWTAEPGRNLGEMFPLKTGVPHSILYLKGQAAWISVRSVCISLIFTEDVLIYVCFIGRAAIPRKGYGCSAVLSPGLQILFNELLE